MNHLEGTLAKADRLRHGAQAGAAVRKYLEAAEQAKQHQQFSQAAHALQFAAVAARQAISRPDSTRFRDAVDYLRAAEALYKELNTPVELGEVYRDLAVTYDCAGRYTEALRYFQQSIEILEKNGRGAGLGLTYAKLGRHFYRKGDFNSAKNYFNKALELFREYPHQGYYQSTTWLDYARTLAKANDLAEAVEWAEQALSWYEADHDQETFPRRRAQLYGLLSVLYDQIGREKSARNFAERYEKLLKSFDPAAAQVLRDELRQTFADETPDTLN